MRTQILEYLHLIFLLILFSSFPLTVSRSQSALERGNSISVAKESDFITSPDNTFTCGFHSFGTNAYWFAIWFTNSREKTVVWTANPDRPVNGLGSKVILRRDGTMVLADVDGSVIWQTNTMTADVAAAELLSTGNLVLKSPRGDILWQSFDSPTDTLLPSQVINKDIHLKSAMRKGTFEIGYFTLCFGSDNVFKLISDTPETSIAYWPNPYISLYQNGRTNYNSTRIASLDDMGRFQSSDQLQFNASDIGYGIKRRLALDYDGNLRLYSLINSTGLWDITWQALNQPCSVLGVCGRNAICVYAPQPKCTCPPGFVVNDPKDWNKGCKAIFNQTLLNSQQVNFLEIPHTEFYGFDLLSRNRVTLETCRDLCLKDFRCQGFGYRLVGEGACYVKSALLNGYTSPDFPGNIYLKLSDGSEAPTPNVNRVSIPTKGSCEAETIIHFPAIYNFNNRSVNWVYFYSFAAALGAIELVIIVLGWWFLLRKNGVPASIEAGYHMISSQFRQYTYSELKKATNNFKEELGRGGSGIVYRGILSNRLVAVKKLGDFFQAQDEYFAEIRILGQINHMNLVRTLGFCSDRRNRLLIYEYLENSSLDKHLFGSNFLQWKQRYAVALGTAKGLAYLHHECLEWVIHCDVKPENILLDGEFHPKISDFGLAKLSQRGGSDSKITRIRGTKGYMAPEWALNQPITAKVDVFGYGVVILEMVRGIRVCDWVVEDDEKDEVALRNFVRKIEEKMKCGNLDWVESVVDRRLGVEFSRDQAAAMVKLGIYCVADDRNRRPTMAAVVQTLLECEDERESTNELGSM